MPAQRTMMDAAVADKTVFDPGTGKAIGVSGAVSIVPLITTTTAPSTTTVTKTASETALSGLGTAVDRSETATIAINAKGGAGAAGTGGNGGVGGGGGEYTVWTGTTLGSGTAGLDSLNFDNDLTPAGTSLTLFGRLYVAVNGINDGTGGTGGSDQSTGAATTSRAGGAGGAGQVGGGAAGGGGGEGAASAAAGNAGSAGSAGTGGAGGTGTAGADGGAGGSTGAVGAVGTAGGGGGGGGANGFAGGAAGAGSVSITYTGIAETNTLPDPLFAGATLILWAKTLVCNRVITASTAFDSSGNNVIGMDNAGDIIILKSVPASTTSGFRWEKIATNGPVLWAA